MATEALKARNKMRRPKITLIALLPISFRAFSAENLYRTSTLGRWPRLLHLAPLALRLWDLTRALPLLVLDSAPRE